MVFKTEWMAKWYFYHFRNLQIRALLKIWAYKAMTNVYIFDPSLTLCLCESAVVFVLCLCANALIVCSLLVLTTCVLIALGQKNWRWRNIDPSLTLCLCWICSCESACVFVIVCNMLVCLCTWTKKKDLDKKTDDDETLIRAFVFVDKHCKKNGLGQTWNIANLDIHCKKMDLDKKM